MKTTQNWSKVLLAGMAAMLLSFGLVLAGCSDDSSSSSSPYGNGTVTAGGETYRANLALTGKDAGAGNWTLTVPDGGITVTGTWSLSGATVSFTGADATGTGTLSGSTVTATFSYEGNQITGVFSI